MPGTGWKPEFDERSRNYPVRAPQVEPVLASITRRAGVVLDQGPDGTCVGHGHEGCAGARPIQRPISHEHALEWYLKALPLDEWPENDNGDLTFGTSVLAGAKAGVELGIYEGFDWGFSLTDLIHGVCTRTCAVIGIPWYDSMFEPDENGILPEPSGGSGGHCVLVRGVALKRRWVRIRNSWGPSWGLGGDARIRFEHMERLIGEGAEILFPREVPV